VWSGLDFEEIRTELVLDSRMDPGDGAAVCEGPLQVGNPQLEFDSGGDRECHGVRDRVAGTVWAPLAPTRERTGARSVEPVGILAEVSRAAPSGRRLDSGGNWSRSAEPRTAPRPASLGGA